MEMKRYNHIPIDTYSGYIVPNCRIQEIEAEDGEWVRYEDIKHLYAIGKGEFHRHYRGFPATHREYKVLLQEG